jgi:hypothetical protein
VPFLCPPWNRQSDPHYPSCRLLGIYSQLVLIKTASEIKFYFVLQAELRLCTSILLGRNNVRQAGRRAGRQAVGRAGRQAGSQNPASQDPGQLGSRYCTNNCGSESGRPKMLRISTDTGNTTLRETKMLEKVSCCKCLSSKNHCSRSGSGSSSQRYGSGSFSHQANIVRNLLFCDFFWTFYL